MKVGIVNYSLGNVGSVFSAFKFYKYNVELVHNASELAESDIIVLAGVGNFRTAVTKLREYQLWDQLQIEVLQNKKPTLGICLGMQLFADISYEDGINEGFGWIKGKVVKIEANGMIVPNIGWNEVNASNNIFKDIENNFFYFMHSYHFLPEDKNVIIATTKYGEIDIVSAVKKNNIVGIQFHPEKSQGDGLRFLRNYLEELGAN